MSTDFGHNTSPRKAKMRKHIQSTKQKMLTSDLLRSISNGSSVDGLSQLYQMINPTSNYTLAFGDGPRNFEPWSSDKDDT
ncbi:hypothetical protein TNCV_2444661 [Trichonephila clavipes]|nr:hypothetical protein TNCV_2444661 [Trichonephila clavipes]